MDILSLETNIAIDILNGDQTILQQVENAEVVCLPVIVVGELLYGARNSRRSADNLALYQAFIKACRILPIDQQVAEEYSLIRKKLKSIGRPIPENDIWIAAISRVNNISLITRDQHFGYVEGLELISLS